MVVEAGLMSFVTKFIHFYHSKLKGKYNGPPISITDSSCPDVEFLGKLACFSRINMGVLVLNKDSYEDKVVFRKTEYSSEKKIKR